MEYDFDCLPHTPDAVQILDKHDFEQHDRTDTGISPPRLLVQPFYLVIDKHPCGTRSSMHTICIWVCLLLSFLRYMVPLAFTEYSYYTI